MGIKAVRRPGGRRASPAAVVVIGGRSPALAARTVRRVVLRVLRGERRRALVSVTFLGPTAMRHLNRRYKRHDRPTDVLAFPLPGPGGALAGDLYLCAAVARREARTRGLPLRQELIRLLVHGTLHLLGHDHPETDARIFSPMWRRQERYVRMLA